ncbi:hypothetical protein ACFVW1_14655 [Streptomyces olivochromogenes]|uniref:hypothetical protein n=1 Tax=Streptomyces olivochromogenes TaxID=1963 RepID=UPI0036D99C45
MLVEELLDHGGDDPAAVPLNNRGEPIQVGEIDDIPLDPCGVQAGLLDDRVNAPCNAQALTASPLAAHGRRPHRHRRPTAEQTPQRMLP